MPNDIPPLRGNIYICPQKQQAMKEYSVKTTVSISADGAPATELNNKLHAAALEAAHKAYAPYSKFRVGAAALLDNGTIVTGSNQENAAYPSGICAERVTLFYANAHYPNNAVTHLMICAETDNGELKNPITPCGACRQVIIEKENIQGCDMKVILASADAYYTLDSAKELLPLSFIPNSLLNA